MPVNSITVPAITQIKIIHSLQIVLQLLRVVGAADSAESNINQHVEEQPVAVIARMGINLIQPAVQLLLFLLGKW
ncbi:hypothetical protein D3C76_1055830 [compost metagenome]